MENKTIKIPKILKTESKTTQNIDDDKDIASISLLTKEFKNQLWLSISEAAKVGGVTNKTIRRAIKSHTIKYKVIGNRYLVDLKSLVLYLHTKKKLANKLEEYGIGQYIESWKQ